MKCPKCGARTEVLETTQKDERTHRRRSCLHCGHRFSTREVHAEKLRLDVDEAMPQWLEDVKRRVKRGKLIDVDAVEDAIRVDRRRARIMAEQRALDRRERDALREAGLDDRADEIDRETLRRELEGY